jgi:ABC-type antimicrobial peptide transport system permease subunit
MNTFLKFNKNIKSQKATIILLSLFLIFFISSIIGIIYSYNKRIFQLAKQERDNYKVFKKQFDDMFANLYIVDLIDLGWQPEHIKDLSFISTNLIRNSSLTDHYKGSSSNQTIKLSGNIDIKDDIFYLSSSRDEPPPNPPINRPYPLPSKELKEERDKIADRLNTDDVKNEIEGDLKYYLGNNIEILKFAQDSNNDNEIKKIKKVKKVI